MRAPTMVAAYVVAFSSARAASQAFKDESDGFGDTPSLLQRQVRGRYTSTLSTTQVPVNCSESGFAYEPYMNRGRRTANEMECLLLCKEKNGCAYYNYRKGRCRFSNAMASKVKRSDYVSGDVACSPPSTDAPTATPTSPPTPTPTLSPTMATVSCFETDFAYVPFMKRGRRTANEIECMFLCKEKNGCAYYNYKNGRCRFSNAMASKVKQSGYVSGDVACSPPPTEAPTATPTSPPTPTPTLSPTLAKVSCFEVDSAYMPFMKRGRRTANEIECLFLCKEKNGCAYYNYKKGRCRFSNSMASKVKQSGYVSGDVACSPPPTEAPTEAPTKAPTARPTRSPTKAPTKAPTATPTSPSTAAPTLSPTLAPSSCSEEGYAYLPFINRGRRTADNLECLFRCKEKDDCTYYNYKKGRCRFANATAKKVQRSDYVSGDVACSFPPTGAPTNACNEVNYAYLPFMRIWRRTEDEIECLIQCVDTNGCTYYNYKNGWCRFAKGTARKVRRYGYVSGDAGCPLPPMMA